MNLVTRAEWGARSPRGTTKIPRTLGFGVHWEGVKLGAFAHDVCDDKVRGIQKFHMDGHGWVDIAYSFLVCPHGYVFEGRGWGIKTAANGTNFGNDNYLAACYLGGPDDPFTDQAKQAYHDLFAEGRRRYDAINIKPHSSFKATACPGDVIRKWVADGCPLPNTGTPPPPPPQQEDDMQFRAIRRVEDGAIALVAANYFKHVSGDELNAAVAAGLTQQPSDEVNAIEWDRVKALVAG